MPASKQNVSTADWWQVVQNQAKPSGLRQAVCIRFLTLPCYVRNADGVLYTYRRWRGKHYWLQPAHCGLRLVTRKDK